jgi:hypothetical protein
MLVQEHRDAQFITDAPADCAGYVCAFLHGDSGDRNEGTDVERSKARMFALVFAHVYEFGSFARGTKSGLGHWIWLTREGDHGPVGVRAGIDVQ